ncbi:hypothetical protein PN473_08370, partial [Dolichospermum circinale CS-545/17]|nr:hypothetical protein [Dolichospermum circinale CS-545/17]
VPCYISIIAARGVRAIAFMWTNSSGTVIRPVLIMQIKGFVGLSSPDKASLLKTESQNHRHKGRSNRHY